MKVFFGVFLGFLVILLIPVFLALYANPNHEGFLSRSKGTFYTTMGPIDVALEVTETAKEIEQGLMHRTHLAPNTGMLFVFQEEAERAFWMRNTLIPLDMIFINAAGQIVHIEHNVPTQNDIMRSSKTRAKYVVELPGGTAKTNNIQVGDRFSAHL